MLGEEHTKTLSYKNTLAMILSARGRYPAAEKFAREVLTTRRRMLGAEHPSTIAVTGTLAFNLMLQSRYAEAETLCSETLVIARRSMGGDHPFARMVSNNLGLALEGQGRYVEAERLFLEVLETEQRVMGSDHSATRETIYELGFLKMLQDDREAALDWLDHAVVHGFSRVDWMSGDSDLDPLRNHPRFEGLSERARQNAAAQAGQR